MKTGPSLEVTLLAPFFTFCSFQPHCHGSRGMDIDPRTRGVGREAAQRKWKLLSAAAEKAKGW